jgi:hypothetical protein
VPGWSRFFPACWRDRRIRPRPSCSARPQPPRRLTFAIEGTGSYGAGLTSAVRIHDIRGVEEMRTDRRDRRLRGNNDTIDTETAGRWTRA